MLATIGLTVSDAFRLMSTFRALVKAEPEGDIELQAALHSAGVVSYARPFTGGGEVVIPDLPLDRKRLSDRTALTR